MLCCVVMAWLAHHDASRLFFFFLTRQLCLCHRPGSITSETRKWDPSNGSGWLSHQHLKWYLPSEVWRLQSNCSILFVVSMSCRWHSTVITLCPPEAKDVWSGCGNMYINRIRKQHSSSCRHRQVILSWRHSEVVQNVQEMFPYIHNQRKAFVSVYSTCRL